MDLADLRIVLVRPEASRNVGAACRAAKTMGIEQIRLVAAEAIDWHMARVVAVHAADLLERAVLCDSVAEAVSGCTLAAAVTRRDGKRRKYRIWTAEQLGRRLAELHAGPVAVVFGNEKNGLSDAEMEPCQVAVAIPSAPQFPSLNLSHAVQVVAYEIYKQGHASRQARPRQRPVGAERIARMAEPLTGALAEVGFFSTAGASSVQRFLTDILTRADLVDREAERLERILHNVGGVVLRTARYYRGAMVRLGSVIMGQREGDAAVGTTHGSGAADVHALARAHRERGLSAAYCPRVSVDDGDRMRAIRDAFAAEDVLLAEVGGWRNMLHPDPAERTRERQRMAEYLAIADEVGAVCAITCIGSPGGPGQGSHDAFNFTPDAFDAAVDNARWLIDTVKPKRARFVYEIYPFSVADSPDNIRRLLDAVDRPEFAAHMDLVNLINTPRLYYENAAVVRAAVRLFGDRIVSAHAKDLAMQEEVSVIMHEVRPGCGNIDYAAYLRVLHDLPQTVPLMLEHLHTQKDYDLGADYIRQVAEAEQIAIG